MDLSACYRPLTAAPYRRGNTYWESAPCAALRPWVRCFWRTGEGAGPSLVIPDTCIDLMLYREPGGWRGAFCALNDRPFTSTGQRAVAFAIRLYPWAGAMFAQESLAGACNGHFDGRQHFPNLMERLLPALASCDSFEDCRAAAEACLLSLGGGRPTPGRFPQCPGRPCGAAGSSACEGAGKGRLPEPTAIGTPLCPMRRAFSQGSVLPDPLPAGMAGCCLRSTL